MSCLILADLPLSDQVAIELTHAETLRVKALALLAPLDSPAETAVTPCTASTSLAAGESIFSSLDALMEIHLCP